MRNAKQSGRWTAMSVSVGDDEASAVEGVEENSDRHPQRMTFMPSREILMRSRDALLDARTQLERSGLADRNERARLFCGGLARLESELEDALAAYVDRGPESVLEERRQYTWQPAEGWPGLAPSPGGEPPDTGVVVTWTLDLIASLEALFRKLADSAATEEARAAHTRIADLLQAYQRRITRLQEGQRDL